MCCRLTKLIYQTKLTYLAFQQEMNFESILLYLITT